MTGMEDLGPQRRSIDEALKLARQFRGCLAESENRNSGVAGQNTVTLMRDLLFELERLGYRKELTGDAIDSPSSDQVVERGGSLYAALNAFAQSAVMMQTFREQAPQAIEAVEPTHRALQPIVYRSLVLYIEACEQLSA